MRQRAPAVIWEGPPKWSRARLLGHFKKKLLEKVDEAYLIGSYAAGTATGQSDIDLIVVTPTLRPWPERGLPYLDLLKKYVDVDVLVYTPREWETLRRNPTTFLAHAGRTWKRIL